MGIVITESTEELITSGESLEKNNKQKEYLDYINDHINNVKKAFVMFFVPLLDKTNISTLFSDEEFHIAIRKAAVCIKEHDASKYGDEEFDGYREKYYPTANELADSDFQKKAKEKSEKAWVHHYTNNKHHPKCWMNLETGIIQDMDFEYIIEMICDWTSFNIKAGNPHGVIDWYNNEATHEKDEMTDKTRAIVEELLFKVIF